MLQPPRGSTWTPHAPTGAPGAAGLTPVPTRPRCFLSLETYLNLESDPTGPFPSATNSFLLPLSMSLCFLPGPSCSGSPSSCFFKASESG